MVQEKKKNVLFLLGVWSVGGVERVTVALGNALITRGWRVTVVAFRIEDTMLLKSLSPEVVVKVLTFPAGTTQNLKALRALLLSREISVVINQWALPYGITRLIRRAGKGLGVRIIEVLHNIPNNNGRIASSHGIQRLLWQVLSGINLRLTYHASDAFLLLSERFKPIFRRATWLWRTPKLEAISNPLTLPTIPSAPKEKVLLYVGRLEETQKRVSRVLDVWRLLSTRFPEWRLEIVGDGPDREALERQTYTLPRVTFHGFQAPAPFYARASLLLLTSDFEGFPLVLAESMYAACVPIVLGSYPAAYDIIRGANGVVIAPPFSAERFARITGELMAHPNAYEAMAERARQTAASYSVEAVADRWENLLETVIKGGQYD